MVHLRGGEVARRGVGEGENGGLEVAEFSNVGLEEGDGLFGQAGEDDALDVALLDAFCRCRADIFGEFLIVEVHQGDADTIAEREGSLRQDVMPVSMADQGQDSSGVWIV